MPYPQRFTPKTNYSRDEQLGTSGRGEKLDADFSAVAEITNQLVTFLRQFVTSDGKLKLDQAVRLLDVVTVQVESGAGGAETISFDQPIDSAVDLVRTWVDGVRVDPDSYDDDGVTLATTAGTDNVEIRIYTNLAGVLDRVQSVVSGLGASFVGYDDPEGRFDADNVRDALTEAASGLDALTAAIGDLSSYLLRDGSRSLLGQWEVNPRASVTVEAVSAAGSVTVSSNPSDGDTLVIDDGVQAITFEFDDDSSSTGTPVSIGADPLETGASLVSAINSSPSAVTATGEEDGASYDITLTHQVPGADGNQSLSATGGWDSGLSGMSGGVDGSFSAALSSYYRFRNHPRSARDGDVAVHEQITDLRALIAATTTAYLRADGGNAMNAPLKMGGYPVVDIKDAEADTEAASWGQVKSRTDTFLPLAGGTMTGPASMGQTGSEQADADQADSPTVKTWYGVPRPGDDDHVVNKKYVDDLVTFNLFAGRSLNGISDSTNPGATGPEGQSNTGVPLGPGYYQYRTVKWGSGGTLVLPHASFIQVAGDADLTGTLQPARASYHDRTGASLSRLRALGVLFGGDGTGGVYGSHGAGGGGSLGAGGDGDDDGTALGGAAVGLSLGLLGSLNPAWASPWLLVGGLPSMAADWEADKEDDRAVAGGSLVMFVDGDLDLAGCTIDVSGEDASNDSGKSAGAGGAGSVWILCTGTVTTDADTEIIADGGGGQDLGGFDDDSGGGGGGAIVVVAASVDGPGITMSANGGASPGDGGSGGSGDTQMLISLAPVIEHYGALWGRKNLGAHV